MSKKLSSLATAIRTGASTRYILMVVSKGSNTDRPSTRGLIKDAKKRKFDTVLVYKLDRLSRSQKDTLYLIEDIFIKNNIAFLSLQENFDTSYSFWKGCSVRGS